jgi:uncharacterized protein (DUF1501 family)
MAPQSRRDFIRRGCCTAAAMAAASSFSRLGLIEALAQGTGGYKALVCIFLFGGNDSNNLLIPMDSAGYANYLNIRKSLSSGGLALDQSSLLPITAKTAQNGFTQFGLHPQLTALQTLFGTGNLAFMANVGSLVQPVTRAQYLAKTLPVPANLFSHSDQQQQWETSDPSGFGTTGWAGRLADKIQPIYNVGAQFPPITTVAGTAIFCNGQQNLPFAMIPGSSPGLQGFDASAQSQARLQQLQQLLTFDTGVSLIQATSSITKSALTDSAALSGALASAGTLQTVFPNTAIASSIGSQLLQIAKIIKVRSQLDTSLNRQIFFASLGGFDTHSNQIATQDSLFSQLSPALSAFYNATVELGVSQQVTAFTMSDFGRTFQPASGGGTDHAWGNVQMILGGAVKGGDIFGKLPTFAPGGPDDSGSNGRWIPTTSIDQYGATLATWFGVQSTDLPAVFPNIANFTTQNIGFI